MSSWHSFTVICVHCGKKVVKSNKQEVCSIECRDALKKKRFIDGAKEGICPACGEKKKLIYKARGIQVCSTKCRSRVYSQFRRDEHDTKERIVYLKPSKRDCDWCGKEFVPFSHVARFCSRKCSGNWRYHHGGKKEKEIEKRKRDRENLETEIGHCALCGTFHTMITPLKEMNDGKSRTMIVKFHRDHIIPRSNGGPTVKSNIRYLCWFCNVSRGNLSQEYDDAIAAAGKAFWESVNSR